MRGAWAVLFNCFFASSLWATDAVALSRGNYPAGYQTECVGFEEFLAICRKPETRWARRYVYSEALETHYPLNFIRAGEAEFVWADGDLRWVMQGLEEGVNRSKSENRGFNYGAFPFVYEGAFHHLGGYGFWRNHADWISFMPQLGEWEINRVNGEAPVGEPYHACWQTGHTVHWLGLNAVGNGEAHPTRWRTLDLKSRTWSDRGTLELPMGQGWRTVFNLENYVVLLDGSNGYALLRKADGHVAMASADQWAVELWRASNERGTLFSSGDVLGWTSPAGDVSTWDFAARAEDSVFLNYFVPVEPPASNSPSNTPWLWLPVLGAGGVALGLWWGKRGIPRRAEQLTSVAGEEAVLEVAHWSPELRALLLHPERELLTAELDELLGISDAQSPETLRARRARTISAVNAEFELLFGYTLIQRERGSSDRRKVVYRLAAPPSMVRKLLGDRTVKAHKVTESPPVVPAEPLP